MASNQAPHEVYLGLVGGAGPMIAARVHQCLLTTYQSRTGAVADHGFPGVLVANQWLAGVDKTGVADPGLAEKSLAQQVARLRSCGATHWFMACASLHGLPSATSPDCIDWLSLTARRLRQQGLESIGVVGSRSSRRDRLFERACHQAGLEPIVVVAPLQAAVDTLIAQGMTGRYSRAHRALVRSIEASLAPRCPMIWWGCTELSFIPRTWFTHPALRSLEAMIDTVLPLLETRQ